MASEANSKDNRPKWSLVVITVALTALGTSLASTWLPGLIGYLYEKITKPPIVVVEVKRSQQPVSGVKITATDLTESSDSIISDATTDDKGIARLRLQRSVSLVSNYQSLNIPLEFSRKK